MKEAVKSVMVFMTITLLCSCSSEIPSVKTLPPIDVVYAEKKSYIIGPSDVLEINVWKESDLTKQVIVRMDGKITLPLINDVQAENQTLLELQEVIEEKYKEYVEVPEVTVILLQSNSRKIYIHGKIRSSGEYPLRKEMTFLQAISVAGGLDKWADKDNIRLIRKVDGVEKSFRIDYEAIISGKDLSQNILLLPDDTIFIP
ncbi:polysaccharide biosynthesis/export family protein [Thermodesulfobacteriota bacterium]